MERTETNNSIPNPIREARLRRGLTQPAAAAILGYSPAYYAMMEREPRCIAPRFAQRLVTILGVPADDVVRAVGLSADRLGLTTEVAS